MLSQFSSCKCAKVVIVQGYHPVLFRNPNPSGEGLVTFDQFLHNKQALAELVHGTVHCHLVPRPKHGLLSCLYRKSASIAIDKKVLHPDVKAYFMFPSY